LVSHSKVFFFFNGHSKVSLTAWLPLLLFDLCIFFGSHYIFYLEMSHNVFLHVWSFLCLWSMCIHKMVKYLYWVCISTSTLWYRY
jgi:hypothetical protein